MRSFLTFTVFLLIFRSLFCLNISLSPLNQPERSENSLFQEEVSDFSSLLIRAVKGHDTINTLHFSELIDQKPVLSLLEAGIFASRERIDYLLYGTLYREKKWIEVRLSLYERETDRVKTIFYGKADSLRYHDLIEELAGKISRYFYGAYHIEPALIQRRWEGFGTLRVLTGYWGVMFPWNKRLTGISFFALKGTLTPGNPVIYLGDFTIFPGFGGYGGYSLGFNTPGHENFIYHSFQIAFPLEISVQWRDSHCFTLSLTGGSQIDGLFKSRLYGDSRSDISQTGFLKVGLVYEYLFPGSHWFLGLAQEVDFTFYNPLLTGYKPSLTWGYRFSHKGKSTKEFNP